jgi:hypothetical protein
VRSKRNESTDPSDIRSVLGRVVEKWLSFKEEIRGRRKVIPRFQSRTEIRDMLSARGRGNTSWHSDFGTCANRGWPRRCEKDVRAVGPVERFGIANRVERQILVL